MPRFERSEPCELQWHFLTLPWVHFWHVLLSKHVVNLEEILNGVDVLALHDVVLNYADVESLENKYK